MENKKKTSALLLILAILFPIVQAVNVILYTKETYLNVSWIGYSVICAVLCFGLYCSYATHSKNIMKPLLGAALILLFLEKLDWGTYYFEYIDELSEWYPDTDMFMIYAYMEMALLVIITVINIMHYIINASHHSSPRKVAFNKYLYITFLVLLAVQCVDILFLETSTLIMISHIASNAAIAITITMVILVESSVDEFRINRENKAIQIENQ